MIYTFKGFGVVNKAKVDVFSGTLLLFQWSTGCWQFKLWFLCLFWIQFEHLEIHSSRTVEAWLGEFWACEMSAIVQYFEHSLALPFFGFGMKTDLFQSCGHCWVFQICQHTECSTFTAPSFRIWNSSTRIPSPPLALFVVMLPKAHLTSHSRVFGTRRVITPSWLSGSWRSFLYSSSVYAGHLLLDIVNKSNLADRWKRSRKNQRPLFSNTS